MSNLRAKQVAAGTEGEGDGVGDRATAEACLDHVLEGKRCSPTSPIGRGDARGPRAPSSPGMEPLRPGPYSRHNDVLGNRAGPEAKICK